MTEIRDFHPLVASWLTENGYTYKHEFKMPEYGKADFVAQHADGHRLIVECKIGYGARDGRSIIQLLDYGRQMPDCRMAYAIPSHLVSDNIIKLCENYSVMLLPIHVDSETDPIQIETNTKNTAFSNLMSWIEFRDKCRCSPAKAVDEIVRFHDRYGTSPVMDVFRAKTQGIQMAILLGSSQDQINGLETHYDYFIDVLFRHDERYKRQVEAAELLFNESPRSYVEQKMLGVKEVPELVWFELDPPRLYCHPDAHPDDIVKTVREYYRALGKDDDWITDFMISKI